MNEAGEANAIDATAGQTGRRERRRQAILSAARALFLERGYETVSLGEIVRRSGGSLSTLYCLFENKEGLLRAIVAEERFEGIERLDALVARGDGAAETLRAIARWIQADLARPEMTRLMRLVVAKSLDDAAFAQAIYDNGHMPRVLWLSRLFERWAQTGEARMADPVMAAHYFFGLTMHAAQTHTLFGDPADMAILSCPDYLAGAVDLFVAGYAIGAGDARRPA